MSSPSQETSPPPPPTSQGTVSVPPPPVTNGTSSTPPPINSTSPPQTAAEVPPNRSISATPPPKPSKGKLSAVALVGLVVGLVILAGFVLAAFLFLIYEERRTQRIDAERLLPHGPERFTYEALQAATNNFSSSNFLGEGGFADVFKGVLPDGKVVAIKCLKPGRVQGEHEFRSELEIVSRIHHRHLVSLVGYCIYRRSQRFLVYEFVPNKTLEFHLHGEGRPVLDWSTRMKIALGSAKGLAYLHEDCNPKIIHRDIKSANILIDDSLEAKVADFGFAKQCLDAYTHFSTRVIGSFGYLAPEYAASGQLTEKADVYSFGVLLLELITGRPTLDRNNYYSENGMVDWAMRLLSKALKDGNFVGLIDPKLQEYDYSELSRMASCAASCVRHTARFRPRMSRIVGALEGTMSVVDLTGGSSHNSTQGMEDMNELWKMALEGIDVVEGSGVGGGGGDVVEGGGVGGGGDDNGGGGSDVVEGVAVGGSGDLVEDGGVGGSGNVVEADGVGGGGDVVKVVVVGGGGDDSGGGGSDLVEGVVVGGSSDLVEDGGVGGSGNIVEGNGAGGGCDVVEGGGLGSSGGLAEGDGVGGSSDVVEVVVGRGGDDSSGGGSDIVEGVAVGGGGDLVEGGGVGGGGGDVMDSGGVGGGGGDVADGGGVDMVEGGVVGGGGGNMVEGGGGGNVVEVVGGDCGGGGGGAVDSNMVEGGGVDDGGGGGGGGGGVVGGGGGRWQWWWWS